LERCYHSGVNTPSLAAKTLSWHVLGAGAIGGLWALRLASRGIPVTLIAHGDDAGERTLRIDNAEELPAQVFLQRPATDPGVVEALLVTTKSQLTADALKPLLPHLPQGIPVLLLQNGMGAETFLRWQRPDLCLLTGISTDGVWRRERDHLVLAGRGETVIGADQAAHADIAQAIAAELHDPRWPVQAVDDIQRRRWLKLAMNCAINPLTAIHRCRNGELLQKPEALTTMQAVCDEVAAVMTAEGMASDGATLFQAACAAAEKTAANISSMHADVAAGRETEIDFINGHVLARAAAHGIDAPTNTALLERIRALPH
ncbi:MAG TPA: ketopantoate reductase family protein, partial [Moraxellaceae bacterium]